MTTRLILWRLGTMTITKRGIWEREREIHDVVELDTPEQVAEWRASFARDVAASAARGVRLEVTEHEVELALRAIAERAFQGLTGGCLGSVRNAYNGRTPADRKMRHHWKQVLAFLERRYGWC
jgi:hypothetical protein